MAKITQLPPVATTHPSTAAREAAEAAGGVFLDADEMAHMRRVLCVGLSSLGIIESLSNAYEMELYKGVSVPKSLKPPHPTGDPETISEFAMAFMLMS